MGERGQAARRRLHGNDGSPPARRSGTQLPRGRDLIVIEEIDKACATTTIGRITVEAHLGAISAILHYGSDEQQALAAQAV